MKSNVLDFSSFRVKARGLLHENTAPGQINWNELQENLFPFGSQAEVSVSATKALKVPFKALKWMETIALHARDEKWPLLYKILWRLQNGENNLLNNPADADVLKAERMYRQVRRDIHKMHAFLRFKKTRINEEEIFFAWHKPDHLILKAAAGFFVKRFGSMKFSIFTPPLSAHWDLNELHYSEGMLRQPETGDEAEEYWKTYYASIFNPARIKVKMMKREMPVRYWQSMPETRLIPELLRTAPERLKGMRLRQKPQAVPPSTNSLLVLKEAALKCSACRISLNGCRAVFGEGPPRAHVMIVGEQPGDTEDLRGRPFVGPAGKLLDKLLALNDIDRAHLYMTNAVKHFKYESRGKRRLHKRPDGDEILACKPWLTEEIRIVSPKVILCLGSTAAQAVLGQTVSPGKNSGKCFPGPNGSIVLVTFHPSAALRVKDAGKERFITDEISSALRLSKDLRL